MGKKNRKKAAEDAFFADFASDNEDDAMQSKPASVEPGTFVDWRLGGVFMALMMSMWECVTSLLG